jgi:predicted TIM-barrel fold metal-dependent hydrolase
MNMTRRLTRRSLIIGFAASTMAPPASRAQTLEQFNARKSEPRRPAASRAPVSRIIDSEAHTWVKIPNNWRHHAPDEPRALLSPRSAESYQPSRPAPDGSFVMSEDTSEELLKHMDWHGIDMALIYPGAFMCPNDEIAKVVARAPKKFIGFAKYGKYMPPFSSPQEEKLAMDDLEHGLRDLGLRGVGEVSCEQWSPLPPRAAVTKLYPIFEICRTYSAPVVVHAHAGGGSKNIDYCNPALFEPVIRDFPQVPVILNHMGGARKDFFDAAMNMARRYDQVRFNTSQTTPGNLTVAVREIGAERIFFGSDWYALDTPETREVSQHRDQLAIVAKAQMSDRERELVLGESIAAFLKL